MTATTTLTLIDGVRIVVPNSLNLITPYVLREQLDWFEDEIKFLRCLLPPGQQVIDIGANHGVYALSMAKCIGASGHLWAFEPASSTAQLLAASIQANDFTQISLQRCALSKEPGSARLSLHEHSELNALVQDDAGQPSETVELSTLDICLEKFGWNDIAFVKIDAEGEEANILLGGQRFFAELSPLVQYEVKAGSDLHLDLVEKFSALGYASFRLVPGLDLLVPFNITDEADGYLLNLFCCKPDRARALAAQGFLLQAESADAVESLKHEARYDWRNTLGKLPYGALLLETWQQTTASATASALPEALALHAISQDQALPSQDRYRALESSFQQLLALCRQDPSHLRLASLARIARAFGARALAVQALAQLFDTVIAQQRVDPREPFLAPVSRFDNIAPSNNQANWVLAGILEGLEQLQYFSSFYAGDSSHQRLEMIHRLGFCSTEMERRRQLVQQRFGISPTQTPR